MPGFPAIGVVRHYPRALRNARELESSLRALALKPADIAHGLFRSLNRVEKCTAGEGRPSIAEALSRKHLEAFIHCFKLRFADPLLFPAQVTLRFGDELVREPVVAEVSVRNNVGYVKLYNSTKIVRCGFPTAFDTRKHLVRTAEQTLIVIGKSPSRQDFVIWIKYTGCNGSHGADTPGTSPSTLPSDPVQRE